MATTEVTAQQTCTGKLPAPRKRPVTSNTRKQAKTVDRTTEFSDDVLKSLEAGQRAAIQAVQEFVDTVDEKLPSLGDAHPSRRQGIIDAALELADRLIRTQYDFIRKVVDSTGKALRKPDGGS